MPGGPDVFYSVTQGSEEWARLRCGLPTASRFKDVMRKAGPDSKTRDLYMRQLAGEILTGEPMELYKSAAMERGQLMEPEARQHYAVLKGLTPQPVGFIRGYKCGCSPDSLIGDDGILEIKTAEPHIMIDLMRRGTPPMDHYPQCQGNLLIAQRQWIDLAFYWPKLPMLIFRWPIDRSYCDELEGQIHIFNKEVANIVAQVRAL